MFPLESYWQAVSPVIKIRWGPAIRRAARFDQTFSYRRRIFPRRNKHTAIVSASRSYRVYCVASVIGTWNAYQAGPCVWKGNVVDEPWAPMMGIDRVAWKTGWANGAQIMHRGCKVHGERGSRLDAPECTESHSPSSWRLVRVYIRAGTHRWKTVGTQSAGIRQVNVPWEVAVTRYILCSFSYRVAVSILCTSLSPFTISFIVSGFVSIIQATRRRVRRKNAHGSVSFSLLHKRNFLVLRWLQESLATSNIPRSVLSFGY